jgi:hypothetical protein
MYVTLDSLIELALQYSEASGHRFVSRASDGLDRTVSLFRNEEIHSYFERDVLYKITENPAQGVNVNNEAAVLC